MRIHHDLVFDEVLEGTLPLYTPRAFNQRLALCEQLELYALCSNASGMSLTLTVQIEDSPDQIHWSNRNSVPEIDAAALSTTVNTTLVARDSGALLGSGFGRLRIQLAGTNPKAAVKIWLSVRRVYD